MTENITVENSGPVQTLTIPVPKDGGVVVMTGTNGAGKSTMLNAIEGLLGSPVAVTKRDGQPQPGKVEGLGVTLRIGARTTKSGTCEVVSLEDRLRIDALVDPKVKDPVAADKQRIKAILSLSGDATPSEFFDRLPPLVQKEVIDLREARSRIPQMVDVVEFSGLLKRDLEAAAREAEGKQTFLAGQADSKRTAAGQYNPELPTDAGPLKIALRAAIAEGQKIEQAIRDGEIARQRADEMAAKLAEAEKSATGPSVEDAAAKVEEENKVLRGHTIRIGELRDELSKLERVRDIQQTRWERAFDAHAAAEKREAYLASCRKALEVAPPPDLAPAREEAIQKIHQIESDIEYAAKNAAAKVATAEAANASELAKEAAKKATAIRAAAGSIDGILSGMVKCDRLQVQAGRLVTETPRGTTFYADLSEGERWTIAIEIAIDAVGERGVIVIPQTAWEGLAPATRSAIANQVKGRHVTIFTAQVTDGAIGAEVYQP